MVYILVVSRCVLRPGHWHDEDPWVVSVLYKLVAGRLAIMKIRNASFLQSRLDVIRR